jgi:hypothetical protein
MVKELEEGRVYVSIPNPHHGKDIRVKIFSQSTSSLSPLKNAISSSQPCCGLSDGISAGVFADSILTPLFKETPIRF